MTYLSINGKIKEVDQPNIFANDRGLLLGDGLFETIKTIQGKTHFFDEHWARFETSAKFFEFELPLAVEQVKTLISELIAKNELTDEVSVIRITLTRGASPRGLTISEKQSTTLIITAEELATPSQNPISLQIATIRKNEFSPLTQHKTTNYLESIYAKKIAQDHQFDDALFLNTKGFITEATTSNIFIIKQDQVFTPPPSDGLLPGIVRQKVIDLCLQNQIALHEQSLSLSDLGESNGAFLTNSVSEISSVAQIGDLIAYPNFPSDLLNKISALYQSL